jgi:Mg2+ and Co2+ transporter CorA
MEIILDNFHILDINSEIHPSMYFSSEKYSLFILRLPSGFSDELQVTSYPYVHKDGIFYLYDRDKKEFESVGNLQDFYKNVDKKVNIAMHVTKEIFEIISDMEEDFYESRKIENFNQEWFFYKNIFVRLGRVLSKTIHEVQKFIESSKNTADFLEIHFDDILEHLERTNRNTMHALEKLDTLYSFYDSVHNERINKTIYSLTVLSGIFLPLNLIVGFFGMNTSGLPFTQGSLGTMYAGSLLGIIVILIVLIFMFLKKFSKNF